MSFETIACESVSRHDEGAALTFQDESHSVLMMDASRIEVAFDTKAIPENPQYEGNYRIRVTSKVRDDAHPEVVAQYGDEWPILGRTGNRLRYEMTRYPTSHTRLAARIDPLQGLRRALGISTHRQQEGTVRTDTFTLTIGADPLAAAISKLPKDCWTFGLIDTLPESSYSHEDLTAQTAGAGKLIVQPTPRSDDGLGIFERVVWPLHDNSMHAQSVAILGTLPVRDLLKEQHTLLGEGEQLEIDRFFDAGPEAMLALASTYAADWRRGEFSVPYYGLRDMLADILTPSIRLELNSAKAAAQLIREGSEATAEELEQAFEITDGPGNILDALDDAAASIPKRYMKLEEFGLYS